MPVLSQIACLPIRLYQWCISPYVSGCCRFEPGCSHYASESLKRHGVIKGMMLATWRVLRCNPFGGMGYDPVPSKTQKK